MPGKSLERGPNPASLFFPRLLGRITSRPFSRTTARDGRGVHGPTSIHIVLNPSWPPMGKRMWRRGSWLLDRLDDQRGHGWRDPCRL